MNQPMLRPAPTRSEERAAGSPQRESPVRASAYPPPTRRMRPGWRATLIRLETFERLRALQQSTTDPAIDLSYLTDACLQMALERGREEIVKRALDAMCARLTAS